MTFYPMISDGVLLKSSLKVTFCRIRYINKPTILTDYLQCGFLVGACGAVVMAIKNRQKHGVDPTNTK